MGRPRIVETPAEKVRRIRFLILIRSGRTALGLSQRDLAGIVGIHFSALARFESGHLRLKPDHIRRILDYFQQCGISYQNTESGNLQIQLSGERIDGLAYLDQTTDAADQSPRFRL